MNIITPEAEHANSVFITKLCFVAASSAGMLFSIFPIFAAVVFVA
jgi:hypothetical protein